MLTNKIWKQDDHKCLLCSSQLNWRHGWVGQHRGVRPYFAYLTYSSSSLLVCLLAVVFVCLFDLWAPGEEDLALRIEELALSISPMKHNTLHILQLSIAPEIGSDVKLRNQPSWSINQGETRQAKVEPRPTPTVFCSLCPAPSFPSKQFHKHRDADLDTDAKGRTWNERASIRANNDGLMQIDIQSVFLHWYPPKKFKVQKS